MCRHVVEDKVWYGLSGSTDPHPWVHVEGHTLFLCVTSSNQYYTAYDGSEGSEIRTVEGNLVADHLKTMPTPPTGDNLGALPDCGLGHTYRDPNFTQQAVSLLIP